MDTIGGDPGASLFSGGLALRLDAFDQLVQKAGSRFPEVGRFLSHFNINGRGLLLALLAFFLLLILPRLTERMMRRTGNLRTNFRGENIPQSMGVCILLFAAVLTTAATYLVPALTYDAVTWILCVAGFGLLGLLDDVRGDGKIRGLKGHFRAAFKEKTFTTGFLKAVGGIVLGVVLAVRVCGGDWLRILIAVPLLALASNFINLLDLRPGRAGGVFLLLAIPLLILAFYDGSPAGVPPLLWIVLPTFAVWKRDAAARVMLGDAGSNLLGAVLGLAFVQSSVHEAVLLGAVFVLAVVHLIAERHSLTALIAANPILRTIDRFTGLR